MATVFWEIRLYDLLSQEKTAAGVYPEDSTSSQIRYATDLKWTQPLNGLDTFEASVYLDDPMAAIIDKKTCLIKIWRTVDDPANGKSKTKFNFTPDFAGPIIATSHNDGESGKLKFTAISPLWRLQNHFHIRNHHLVLDNSAGEDIIGNHQGGNKDNLPLDQSALMFKLIDLISHGVLPVPHESGLGIIKPLTADYSGTPGTYQGVGLGVDYWPKTVVTAPFYAGAGVNVWSEIFDDLMSRPGGVDIVPQYIHDPTGATTYGAPIAPQVQVDGKRSLLFFKTDVKRGANRSASVTFGYRTSPFNLEAAADSSQLVPGTYGNFVWTVGDGGPNTYFAQQDDLTDIDADGLYMVLKDIGGAKKASLDGIATTELARAKKSDLPVYTAKVSPAAGIYYDIDYTVGDVCKFNMIRDNWSQLNIKQRIYEVVLEYSDNNVESVTMSIADDFTSKVATTP